MTHARDRRFSVQDLVIGSLLILFGSLLLLHHLDVLYLESLGIRSLWDAWPVVFIVIGVAKLFDAPSIYHIGSGSWWIFLGLWLYVSINHVYDLSFRETWPAIIVAWGVSLVWESFTKKLKKSYKEDCNG